MFKPRQDRVCGGTALFLMVLLAAGCDRRAASRQPGPQPVGPPPAQPAAPQPVTASPSAPTLAADGVLPPWKADAALDEKLDTYAAVAQYEIRPPKGYRKKEVAEPGPLNLQVHWVGKQRADRTRPQLTVFLLEMPNTAAKPEGLLERLLIPPGADTQRTAYEAGEIGGLQFRRVGWRGTRSVIGRQGAQVMEEQQGMSYAGRDGRIYILLNFQDSAEHQDEYAETAKLMQAAIATFRKK
jgi:hypothetical protein